MGKQGRLVRKLAKAAGVIDPIRHNTLEARRKKLGLSRVALARILDVDPTSVFRHERGRMSALWDYAMRGVEAEAASPESKQVVRDHKEKNERTKSFIPEQMAEKGYRLTSERMQQTTKSAARRPRSSKTPAPQASKTWVELAADRAEERSHKR
jgi:DNA-binding XRE family transcriptional regulator